VTVRELTHITFIKTEVTRAAGQGKWSATVWVDDGGPRLLGIFPSEHAASKAVTEFCEVQLPLHISSIA